MFTEQFIGRVNEILETSCTEEKAGNTRAIADTLADEFQYSSDEIYNAFPAILRNFPTYGRKKGRDGGIVKRAADGSLPMKKKVVKAKSKGEESDG